MNIKWKDVKKYEGLYQINNYGNVKSIERITLHNRKIKERILKPGLDKDGYQLIGLSKNNKRRTFKIHRLVAIHFIPNPENKSCVNHKDGDKQNNYFKNLEWCTVKENNQHAYDIGLKYNTKKQKDSAIRTFSKKVYCLELDQKFESIIKASKLLNINQGNISQCCNGKLKSAGKHPNTKQKLTWVYIT